MRALITGATGFVGGHLCEHLLAEGDTLAGLSASGRWPTELAHLETAVRLERVDLAAIPEDELSSILKSLQPEIIYHLAAQSNPQGSVADPRGTWNLNLGGTLNLLESVKTSGVAARVVVVSSGICYGDPAPEFIPIREDCPLRPNNPYAASKAAADLLGIQHHLSDRTNVVMVRPFNHAGPRQSARYVLAALALQVAEAEAGRRPLIEVGNLEVVRDFTDVRDVVRAYRLLATGGKAGEIYNLGTGQGTRIAAALDHLRSLARTPVEVRVDPARVRPVDLPFLVADATKLRQAVGWQPRFTIEQTLADMLETFRVTLGSSEKTPP
jgi:GDP-4-dehydro-6-deoxy-D-mannose reductase